MNPWKIFRDKLVLDRKEDEAFYAAALSEFQSGKVRGGIMAKAIAQCDGDELKVKSIYIRLLAAAIRDDRYIQNRTKEEILNAAQRVANEIERAKTAKAKATISPELKPETKKEQNRGLARLWVTFAMIALIAWGLLISENDSNQISSSNHIAPEVQGDSYDKLVSQYEAQYPPINPDSPEFDQSLADKIAARMEQHRNKGQSPEQSLKLAISEFLRPPAQNVQGSAFQRTPSNPVQSRPASGACQFKPVMTNDDYRACGIQPPSR